MRTQLVFSGHVHYENLALSPYEGFHHTIKQFILTSINYQERITISFFPKTDIAKSTWKCPLHGFGSLRDRKWDNLAFRRIGSYMGAFDSIILSNSCFKRPNTICHPNKNNKFLTISQIHDFLVRNSYLWKFSLVSNRVTQSCNFRLHLRIMALVVLIKACTFNGFLQFFSVLPVKSCQRLQNRFPKKVILSPRTSPAAPPKSAWSLFAVYVSFSSWIINSRLITCKNTEAVTNSPLNSSCLGFIFTWIQVQ